MESTDALCLLYVTTADKSEALKISRALVAERLIACANILDNMCSVYRWEGKIETSQECVLIAKTKTCHVAAATAIVKSLHSYDCPCVLSIPVETADLAFKKWLLSEVE